MFGEIELCGDFRFEKSLYGIIVQFLRFRVMFTVISMMFGGIGIYENREKYMAELYQFPIFLSLTENRMKTGNFGYWLYLLKGRE